MLATLLLIIIVFVIVGLLMYVVESSIPMPNSYKIALRVVVLVILLVWVLYKTGLLTVLERA